MKFCRHRPLADTSVFNDVSFVNYHFYIEKAKPRQPSFSQTRGGEPSVARSTPSAKEDDNGNKERRNEAMIKFLQRICHILEVRPEKP